MPKRRKPTAKQRLEDRALDLQPWAGLRAQHELQEQNHSPEANAEAREACRQLLANGYGSDAVFMAWLEQQQAPRSSVRRTNRRTTPKPELDRSWADCWR